MTKETKDVLLAVLKETKRLPIELINQAEHPWIDCEHGVICPVVVDTTNAEMLDILDNVLSNLKDFRNTFHKSWEAIVNTPQEELWAEAIVHYFTTYGLEAMGIDSEGFVYIPDEVDCTPELRKFFVMQTIGTEELRDFVSKTLSSGIALKQQTIENYLTIINYFNFEIDQDIIKNKELKTILQSKLKLVPKNGEEIVRLLNYITTGSTLLVKDKTVFRAISGGNSMRLYHQDTDDFVKQLLTDGRQSCAEVFYRYKVIFLALRKRGFKKEVNKIRRLAKIYWQPKPDKQFISTKILGTNCDVCKEQLLDLPSYELVKIYNKLSYILLSVKETGYYYDMVVVRNGKLFIEKEPKQLNKFQISGAELALRDILKILRDRFQMYYLRIIKPDNLDIAVPTSEKSFIGDLPLYSQATCSNSSVVGIAWEKNDLDLSALLEDGGKVGWNSRYTDKAKEVIYSGDCTRGGAEALFFNSNQKALVMQNVYWGDIDEVNLFISNEPEFNVKETEVEGWTNSKKYIYDPNNIIYSTKLTIDGVGKALGLYDKQDGQTTFTFVDMTLSQANVCENDELARIAIEVIGLRGRSTLKFSDLYETWTQEDFDLWVAKHGQHSNPEDFDDWLEDTMSETIDLTNVSKSKILSVLNDLPK